MLDAKQIRANPEQVKEQLEKEESLEYWMDFCAWMKSGAKS